MLEEKTMSLTALRYVNAPKIVLKSTERRGRGPKSIKDAEAVLIENDYIQTGLLSQINEATV